MFGKKMFCAAGLQTQRGGSRGSGGHYYKGVVKLLAKKSTGIAGLGILFALIDAGIEYQEKGFNWKTTTKLIIGGGIAVAAMFTTTAALPLAVIGLIYGIENTVTGLIVYFKLVGSKIEQGIADTKEYLSRH